MAEASAEIGGTFRVDFGPSFDNDSFVISGHYCYSRGGLGECSINATKQILDSIFQLISLRSGALGVQLNEWSRRVQISLFVGLKARTCVSSNYKCLTMLEWV
ncbi:hypothetical protein SO802_013570 [Lithocarpus litseifolius]|uniref:Uncharacterized protein n=1 Tax=Lithocarpus litseifolius TaxID=425828 RepID=A0AAW2D8P5_9ROSI